VLSRSGVFFVDLTSKVLRITRDERMEDGEIRQLILTTNTSLYTFELVPKVINSKYDQVEMRGESWCGRRLNKKVLRSEGGMTSEDARHRIQGIEIGVLGINQNGN
jgi:hypothetical protein